MTNAVLVPWRTSCTGICSSITHSPLSFLRPSRYDSQRHVASRAAGSSYFRHCFQTTRDRFTYQTPPTKNSPRLSPFRCFTSSCSFYQSNSSRPPSHAPEDGVRFRHRDLSSQELARVFGPSTISRELGNRVLRVLHGRRVAGTLDLDLPTDITRVVAPQYINMGLKWLRRNYPLDEDAAIIRRIEREEQEEEVRLQSRAEEMGHYKPQSGKWGAEITKKGDVYGRSALQEMVQRNMKIAKEKEEEDRKKWLDGEAKDQAKLKQKITGSKELQQYVSPSVMEGNFTDFPEFANSCR